MEFSCERRGRNEPVLSPDRNTETPKHRNTETLAPAAAYQHDELDRPYRATLLDGSTWTWGRNTRGEITSAVRKLPGEIPVPALGADYDYDDIGNRKTATSPILGDFSYTPNSVNQYTAIQTNGTRTVLGTAPVSPPVTVNSTAVDRTPPDTGLIFHAPLTGNNANPNSPVWLQAAVSDGTTTQTRNAWLPASATSLQHDDDGNLTNDGQWTYLWDAENRLVEMETTPAAVQVGRPYRKLTFAYDWTGRRLARTVYGPNAAILSTTRWLYDGWNPVAEFSDQTTGQTLVHTYLWGMDMHGTMQGAGGVGGLLSVSLITNNTITNNFLPSYDGNGNIVAWTASGATAPTSLREYDAFGNVVIEHGTPPCSIGFSTKLEDPETSLLYFGYRYLSPPLGRWLSQDPIEEQGGLNLYGFVRNEGVARVDRLGLITIPLSPPFWDIHSMSSVCESLQWVGFFSEYRYKTYYEMFSLLARTPLRNIGDLKIWRMPKGFMGRIFWTTLGNKRPAVIETEHFVDGWVSFCHDWCYTVDIEVELVVHWVKMNAKYLGNLDKMKRALAHEFDHIANEIKRMDIVVDHLNTNPGRKRFGTKQEAIAYLDEWKDKIDRFLLGTRRAEAAHHKGFFLPRAHNEYDSFLDTWTGPRGDFGDTPGPYELRPWDGSPDPDWGMAWR